MRRLPSPIPHTPNPSSRVSRAGQSLIEAVIAITVLTTGFLGISTLLARSYFLTRVVSDQLTANYLASEGIEIAKNLVDHDVHTPGNIWGSSLTACFGNDIELDYETTGCEETDHGFIQHFAGTPIEFDPVTHLYGYSYDTPLSHDPVTTDFTREIRVTDGFDGNGKLDEITVDSIVRWSSGTVTDQSLDLEDHFYEWQP